jgi:SAM-dependent methyltransferase
LNTETLERIIPDLLSKDESTGEETLKLHIERYEFASKHLNKGNILDIACGVGYGSYIIAQNDNCETITGVDIDADAIKYAKERYIHPKITFTNKNALEYTGNIKYDTIISLETIEHIPNPANYIAHLKTLIKPGGYLIGSVPTTPSVDANPHHVTDFTPASFRRIFTKLGFEEVASQKQIQKFSFWKIALKQEKRAQKMRPNMMSYYVQNPSGFFKRIYATLRYGFSNHYITIVWKAK